MVVSHEEHLGLAACAGAVPAPKDELCHVSGLQDTAVTCKPAPVPSCHWWLSRGVPL